MRTTIDIPDALFRRVKSQAVLRGVTLRTFVLRAVTSELEAEKLAPPSKRSELPIVKSTETYNPSPDRLAQVLEEEDREVLAGH